MRRVLTKAQAIEYMIFAVVALAIITIFPLRLWHENITTRSSCHAAGTIEVGGENVALQAFTPEYDHIASIGFYLTGDYYSDSVTLRVFDENFTLLREESLNTDDINGYNGEGYADVYINLDTEVGKTYYYTLEGTTADFEVAIEMTANSGASNNGLLQYAGADKESYNIITKYIYSQPLRKLKSLIFILVLAVLGIGLGGLVYILAGKKDKDTAEEVAGQKKSTADSLNELCTPQWILKLVGNPLVILLGLAALICIIPLHMFSIFIADIVVLSLGTVMLVLTLLYLINRDYSWTDFSLMDHIKDNWQNLAQSVCLAMALRACINYMNGLYEIHHDIAWRDMVFWIGLSLIVTFTASELFNIYNLLLIIAGTVTACIYYNTNLADMTDIYHVNALKQTCYVIPIIFIMAGYIVRCIVLTIRGKYKNVLKGISWPYTIVTLLLAVAMIVRRNTRTWPIMMTIVFGVLAFRLLFWEKRAVFLANVENGIILHFLGAVLYSLWHRPWESNVYARYPFVFHTVTETACYMSLVVAVALARLFYKYNKTRQIRQCIGEMLLLGLSVSYLFFTMSRTGMLAVIAAGLVCWIAMISGKKKIKNLLAAAGLVVISVVWCFPIAFSFQKVMPGIVGEPRLMEIESYEEDVMVSKDLESDSFITFGRFVQVFMHKMTGMPEHTFDSINLYTIYGKTEQNKDMLLPDENGEFIISKADGYAPAMETASVTDKIYFDDFEPPHEYSMEGEPPAEWYDEDYWYYNTEDGQWYFATWMLQDESQDTDVSNGRMDIYRSYIDQMTPKGHESMGAILADGSESAHAHDIYLQVAFDHGTMIGALFVIWVVMTCAQALIVFLRRRSFDPAAGVVLAVSVTYAVAGVTEWISHPCNPVGCAFLLVVIPMAIMGRERRQDAD